MPARPAASVNSIAASLVVPIDCAVSDILSSNAVTNLYAPANATPIPANPNNIVPPTPNEALTLLPRAENPRSPLTHEALNSSLNDFIPLVKYWLIPLPINGI